MEEDPEGVDAQTLKGIPIFEGFEEKELMRIAPAFFWLGFAKGRVIIREGEFTDSLYIVMEGSVQVRLGEKITATLGPGEVFGELAALGFHPTRSADVIAAEECRCICSAPKALKLLVERDHVVASRLLAVMKRRYRSGSPDPTTGY